MTDGFPGDPGHEGGSQPMRSLKGGCAGVNMQAPMSGENSGASQGPPDGTSGNIAGWDGFLADSGGSRGVSGNDSRTKST